MHEVCVYIYIYICMGGGVCIFVVRCQLVSIEKAKHLLLLPVWLRPRLGLWLLQTVRCGSCVGLPYGFLGSSVESQYTLPKSVTKVMYFLFRIK